MTAWLWTAEDAARATGGRAEGAWAGVNGLSIDTREMEPGDLFVALSGDNRDGHQFVAQALAAGAGAALVAHKPDGVVSDAPLLVVDDTLQALRDLGAAARARSAAKVLAVTGSVGKTSTKEMLRALLMGQGRVHAAVRSFNNHWGVPLTLARMPPDSDYAVIEIGMNHAGEITPLSRLARPHVAFITTVAPVHLEHFESVEGIADAKAEIFAGLAPGGTAVLPADNAHYARLMHAASEAGVTRIADFGSDAVTLMLLDATSHDAHTDVTAEYRGRRFSFRIGAPGLHLAANAVGALAAVAALEIDPVAASGALSDWTPPSGRGARARIAVEAGSITLLDESYNANPASMRAAFSVLAGAETLGRRQAFLGDMLELGPEEAAFHAALAGATEGLDLVHTCGPRMAHLHAALPSARRGRHTDDSAALARLIPTLLGPGDTAMVKGSLGAKMALVVDAIHGLAQPEDTPSETA